jgi:hypothetical protein
MDFAKSRTDEERIVRLAELASEHRDVLDDLVGDPCDPFSVVRAACADLVQRLAEDRRATLVLLGAKDLEGGLLEALLDFPRQDTDAETSRLATWILARAADDGSLMPVICMSQLLISTEN